MYGVPVIKRSLAVEVNLRTINVGDQFFFPDNQIIRGKRVRVYGMEVFTANQLSFTAGALPVVSQVNSLGLIVNLVDASNSNRIFQIPYFTFIASQNGGMIREFVPFELVLTKSFIQITAVGGLVAGEGCYINLIYDQI